EHQLGPLLARSLGIHGGVAFESFDCERADERASAAAEVGAATGFVAAQMMAGVDRVRCAVQRGDADRARELLDATRAHLERTVGPHLYIGQLRLGIAEAELSLLGPDPAAAVAAADRLLGVCGKVARPKALALGLHVRGRALLALGRRDEGLSDLRRALVIA